VKNDGAGIPDPAAKRKGRGRLWLSPGLMRG